MSSTAKLSLLAIEQEVEAGAREWQRQQLQKRLQQAAQAQGAVCPQTGQALQEARFETVTLDTCAGTVTFRAHYGRHPQTGQWQHPIRLLWGLKPRQRLSPQLQDRVAYTAAETDSYERAAKMATKWGSPEAKAWVEPLLHQLKHGQEADVLNTLEALPAQRQAAGLSLSDLLVREIAYFHTHREHLHYQELADKGGPIGTGAMESTCGQVQTRVKRIGQFWKPPGLAHMLALKAALQNDDWSALWSRN